MNKADGFNITREKIRPFRRKIVFAALFLAVLLIIIYGNSLTGPWVFDDDPSIVFNKYVHLKTLDWTDLSKTFYGIHQKSISRPVAYLSLGLNYYFGQLDTFGYHIVNLFIHFCAAIFLFLFIYKTLNLPRLKSEYGASSYAIALLATFFWAVNPVNVTAVTYIVQRMASLAGMFYIMSMYFYLIGRTDEKVWNRITFFILSGLAGVLAIGTKENAVMLPVSIYLYDLLLIQGVKKENIIKNLKYFMLPVTIVASVVIIFFVDVSSILRLADYGIRPFTMAERLLTESRVIVFYISLLLYPVSSRLMLNHDFIISRSIIEPWTTMAAILFIIGCLGLAIAFAKKKPIVSYCVIFFFLNHVIEGSFIPLELVFEHTNYTPAMLFFVPLAIFAIRVLDYFSYRKVIQLSLALLISFLLFAQGHTVYMYNILFKEPYLLWKDNIAKAPNLSRPYNNLGNLLWNWGLYDDAYKAYEKSYHSNRYPVIPMVAAPLHNMGRYYAVTKDYKTAENYFQSAIKINSQYPPTWINLTRTQIQMGDLKGADKTVRAALEKWPSNAWLRSLRSYILLKQGSYKASIKEAWETLIIDSESTDVERVLADAYYRTGRYDRAVKYWECFVSKYKDDLEGYLALIELYSINGQTDKLNGIIARVIILKGSKSWNGMIDEYNKESASHAYVPDKSSLLSIVKKNLLKDF